MLLMVECRLFSHIWQWQSKESRLRSAGRLMALDSICGRLTGENKKGPGRIIDYILRKKRKRCDLFFPVEGPEALLKFVAQSESYRTRHMACFDRH